MPGFELRTVVEATAQKCFDLSLSVDAHTRSMDGSGERAVGGVTNGTLSSGDSVTWEARHFGVPFRMTVAITEYDRPNRFVTSSSEARSSAAGTSTFDDRAGVTQMTDRVRFSAPAGVLGMAVDRVVLARYLARLLTARRAWLKAELEHT